MILVLYRKTTQFIKSTLITLFTKYELRHGTELRHEKTCFSHMRITNVQISLRIRAVWSAPLLFAFKIV